MSAYETTRSLAYDDSGGAGRLVVLLPGAGDLRTEHRFVAAPLAAAGFRVVTADLPGHGESPLAESYTVTSTAQALIELIETLGGGPAVVVGCSFAPAAAVWAATDRPDLIDGVVAISPHFHADDSFKGRLQTMAIRWLLRGSLAAKLWGKLYASWYKTNPPADLEAEIGRMKRMLSESGRRKAVRDTLTAGRSGMDERMRNLTVPALVVFGSLDDHFAYPVAEANEVAEILGGEALVVDGAGHYPHVERPEVVVDAVLDFLGR
ncbi:MAG: alpha/beta hydrolase [Acidimicrobiia bacterium]|nr:alpha/beta hydrolase [Acidimicrobiia bacterium]